MVHYVSPGNSSQSVTIGFKLATAAPRVSLLPLKKIIKKSSETMKSTAPVSGLAQ